MRQELFLELENRSTGAGPAALLSRPFLLLQIIVAVTTAVGAIILSFSIHPRYASYETPQGWMAVGVSVLTLLVTWGNNLKHPLANRMGFVVGSSLAFALLVWGYPSSDIRYFSALFVIAIDLTFPKFPSLIVPTVFSGLLLVIEAFAPGASMGFAKLIAPIGLLYLVSLSTRMLSDRWHNAVAWALENAELSRENAREAQERRAEVVRTMRALDEAYYRLEKQNHELRLARAAAEEARRLKVEFVNTVSHELRTPVNLIVGFAEMMVTAPEAYGAPLSLSYRADLSAIYRSAKQLQALVNDILDLAQMEAGQMSLIKERADIGATVEEAVTLLRPLAEKKGLDLHVSLSHNLPILSFDRARIRQVLLNLLNNAIRFTEQGGIHVEVKGEETSVVVSVADTGPGIAAENLPRVFDGFFQVDGSTTRQHGGTGLGLSISRHFVQLHGGRIWCESEIGKGSTFSLSLPLPEAAALYAPEQDQERSISPRVTSTGKTLAVVDDDLGIMDLFRRQMQSCQVVGVPTFEEALALSEQVPLHAVIMNLEPACDSLGHLQTLQARFGAKNVPLFACPFPSGKRAILDLGVTDYLVKPISRDLLLNAIKRLGDNVQMALVVDDDPDAARMLRRMLSTATQAYTVLCAHSAEEALQIARNNRPDVILLDLIMPGMDGMVVLRALRQDEVLSTIPVIVVSAQSYLEAVTPSPIGTWVVVREGGFGMRELLRLIEETADILRAKPTSPVAREP